MMRRIFLWLWALLIFVVVSGNYMVNATRLNLVTAYVSSVSFGGIPIGSDSSGDGSASAPFLTCDAAVNATAAIAVIYFNGNPAAPPTYTCTAAVTKALTFRGTASGQQSAKIAGSGTTVSLSLQPTGGEVIAFTDVIVDPSLNSGGAAARCVDLTSQSTTYTVIFTNVVFQNWATHCINAPSAAFKGSVVVTNSTCTATSAASCLNIPAISAGGVTVSGGSATITSQTTSGIGGGINIVATASGVTASISNFTATITTDVSLVGAATHYVVRVANIASAVISGGTHTCTIAATRQCYVTGITQIMGAPFSISNSMLSGITVVHAAAAGGIGLYTAEDSIGFIRSNAQNIVVSGNNVSGIGTAHGIFLGSGEDQIARNNTVSACGIGIPAKLSTRPQIYSNTTSDCTSSYSQWKGSSGVVQHDNTWTAGATYTGQMFSVVQDPDTSLFSDGTISNDHFTVAGAAAIQLAVITAGSSAVFSTNDWHLTSGSVNANPWSYQGVNIPLFNGVGGWHATQGPTDTSNLP